MKLRLTFLCIIVVLFAGCARVNLISYSNPAFKDHKFKNILVGARFETFDAVAEFEAAMLRSMHSNNIAAVGQTELLPPFRDYSDSEIVEACKSHNIDAYLIILPRGLYSVTTDVSVGYEFKRLSMTSDESSTTDRPEGTDVLLVEPFSDQIIWKGQSNANMKREDFGFTKSGIYDNAVLAFARKTVEDLKGKNILLQSH